MFTDFFDRSSYFFSRPMLERDGYTAKTTSEGNILLTINALGIDYGDIDVKVEEVGGNHCLVVKGESRIGEEKYSLNTKFTVFKQVESIDTEYKNGLLFIEVKFETNVPSIKINRK